MIKSLGRALIANPEGGLTRHSQHSSVPMIPFVMDINSLVVISPALLNFYPPTYNVPYSSDG